MQTFTLKDVDPLPKKSTYVYLPRSISALEEAKYSNIPYLGEEILNDRRFVDRIVKIFGNNKDDAYYDEKLDDAMFTELVDKMKKHGFQSTRTGDPIPMPIIFQTISKLYPKMGKPEKLKHKYQKLTRSREKSDMDSVHKQEYNALEKLKELFCRRCFVYNCTLHIDPADKADPLPKIIRMESIVLPIEPCGDNCFMHYTKIISETDSNSKLSIEGWAQSDKVLVQFLRRIFGKDYCKISEILLFKKSCTDIYKLDLVEPIPIHEDEIPKEIEATKKSKKMRRKTHAVRQLNFDDKYKPCKHEGSCDGACICVRNDSFCEKFCNCPKDCKFRFPGCKCKAMCNTGICPCFAANRECDPDLCKNNCGADLPTTASESEINCKNVSIQRNFRQHILFAISDVENAGWGVFAKNNIKKNDFIIEYAGELISQDESDRRGIIYENIRCSYLFEVNKKYVLDATLKGNKSRFVNHSHRPNCHPRFKLVNGDYRIGIYAKYDIQAGEELLFNYRYANQDKIKFFGTQGPSSKKVN